MPLSWNEIKYRAFEFSKQWEHETSEDSEAKSFWDGFFYVFGVTRKRLASFEEPVKKFGDKLGFIDLFWKGVLLVEHKSRGKSLEKAYTQALDYFPGIKERDLPKYVLVSDFSRLRLYNLEDKIENEFELKDLHRNVALFGFIAGYQTHIFKDQDPVNIKAAESMGRLHDQMKEVGYEGHPLEVYLVRLLFCLFSEDTGIFERQQFQIYIEERTCEDGSDLGQHLSTVFQVLNTPIDKRLKNLDEQLFAFPYVNGKLFEELLPTAGFDSVMRQTLLDCCALDWSRISPAIFGSLFQSIMNKEARRNLGAHYTSEKNILKLIKPLFLDGLWAEFEKIKTNKNKLFDFHKKLRRLKFIDPACGCGNFLVIAYRELRLLELAVLRASKDYKQLIFDVHSMILVDVDQFFGIEIGEFPAQLAQVALWLIDHQMNSMVSEEYGLYFARIPLVATGTIFCDNALVLDWKSVFPSDSFTFIMGNPPFAGKKEQDKKQKADFESVCKEIDQSGLLDYVCAWYVKAANFIKGTEIRCAFVSTNSITQGEQVGVLWSWMLHQGVKINFAHRTFQWNNESKGKAAVHCVIVGFASYNIFPKVIYEYEDIKGDPHFISVKNINPYLVDAPDIVLRKRTKPIFAVPEINKGSEATDYGFLFLCQDERDNLISKQPQSERWIKRVYGSDEFINNQIRYCLWLVGISPDELKSMPLVMERVSKVSEARKNSKKNRTKEWASKPYLFTENRQPETRYLAIPKVSSERRNYLPIGYLDADDIATGSLQVVPNASLFHFGVLSSTMHMAWMRQVCGRMKSDYQYSNSIVYNNFPWPGTISDKKIANVEKFGNEVLKIRAKYSSSSLSDLYDPLSMPTDLLDAHHSLDKAVDAAYGKTDFKTETERVAFLFVLHEEITSKSELKRNYGIQNG
ncbi:MAG: class I SAM-dependent DNA methyltransferase [Candidatus Riflebacteria bacterium]|nr:class I SAM-dependent DNA methyltransferase [Candidatus Riflebacteria bacterium]